MSYIPRLLQCLSSFHSILAIPDFHMNVCLSPRMRTLAVFPSLDTSPVWMRKREHLPIRCYVGRLKEAQLSNCPAVFSAHKTGVGHPGIQLLVPVDSHQSSSLSVIRKGPSRKFHLNFACSKSSTGNFREIEPNCSLGKWPLK